MMDRLLTVEDVAQILGLSPQTLYNTRYRGMPPGSLAIPIGGRLRFRSADLEAWVAEQCNSGGRR